MRQLKEAVIVAAVRTPVGRAKKGAMKNTRPEKLGAIVVKELVNRSGINPEIIEDVVFGCAMPEGEQGMNIGRIIACKAGLPYTVPGMTVNRFCSSGLQTIAQSAERIMAGFADVIVAGGVETMTMVPMGGNKFTPDPELIDDWPEVYMPMGNTAELVAEKYGVTREEMDAFAVQSHERAMAALEKGLFKEETVPVPYVDDNGEEKLHEVDEGPRASDPEKLAKLKSPFKVGGTVTAATSSQMNDGAAAVLIMSAEKAKELNLAPLAYFRDFQVIGVPPEEMGVGPAYAIPRLLEHAGMTKDQIDLWEVNEAFASQAIYCVTKVLGLPADKVNVNGGAIALGHPLGCTGAKLTVQLIHELKRRGGKFGVISMCIGGGMGAAGLIEMA